MRITNVNISLVLLCLLGSLVAGQEAPPPPRDLQPVTVSAERDITVFFETEFAFNWDDINSIIQSKQFAGAALEELTGKPSELFPANTQAYGGMPGWRALPHTSYFAHVTGRQDLIRGEGSLPLRLHVTVSQLVDDDKASVEKHPDLEVRAEKYADSIIKHLNKVLADLSRRSLEQRLAQLNATADAARRKAAAAEQKVEELGARLRIVSSAYSEPVLHELVSDLIKQQQAIEIELVGMTGRSEALQREVARSSERLKPSSADNDVVRNLKRVVELRKQQLALVKALANQGVPGGEPDKVVKAEEQVVLAEIELARATQATAGPTDARLEKLNDELSQIAVGIAENEAKLKFLTGRRDEYDSILKDAAQSKSLRQQLDSEISQLITLKQEADATQAQVAELESSFRPARVEVFELTTSEKKSNAAKDFESKAEKTTKP